jgi:hypothetical protein
MVGRFSLTNLPIKTHQTVNSLTISPANLVVLYILIKDRSTKIHQIVYL